MQNGYSRDPFKPIPQGLEADVALAAVIYLLRGYATFFCRPRNLRDFNAAKVSLNDFFQCGQLAWRLYRSLKGLCHSESGSMEEYLKAVRDEERTSKKPCDVPPERSPYLIWSILSMLEIQRGNVYRQIFSLDEAARFYRRFHRRLERLAQASSSSLVGDPDKIYGLTWNRFITPKVITALFEMSKVQFDLGYVLESLVNRTLCLYYLVKSEEAGGASGEKSTELRKDMLSAIKFLESERKQSVFDKELIGACFGSPLKDKRPFGMIETIEPSSFKGLIARSQLQFASDVFARIGFILYTLRRGYLPRQNQTSDDLGRALQRQQQINQWLRPFFEAHLHLSEKPDDRRKSWFGQYWLRLVGEKPKEPVDWDSVEEQFAYCLPYDLDQKVINKTGLEPPEFYKAILAATTVNIVNLATTPRRNQALVMRRGYRFRREQGDLSCGSVHEGVKAALRQYSGRKEEGEGTGSRVQNKLVVLRRWQSVNPEFPRPGEHKLRGGGYFLFWQGKGIVVDPGYDFIRNFYDEGFSLEDIDAVIVTHSHPDHDDDLSTLTTLIREWNEHHKLIGRHEEKHGTKKLDFFLNESTNLKFSAWLKSSQVEVGRVIPLPALWWDKDSRKLSDGKIRGQRVILDLRNQRDPEHGYSFELEVMPAWHDDVIGKTEAIGLKFHLYKPNRQQSTAEDERECQFERAGRIGYTGDTGAFGHYITDSMRPQDPEKFSPVGSLYADCDILVAHLGDIKLRELLTKIKPTEPPIEGLFNTWFKDKTHPSNLDKNDRITPERVRDFFHFLIALDLVPAEALSVEIGLSGGKPLPLCKWIKKLSDLEHFNQNLGIDLGATALEEVLTEAAKKVFEELPFDRTSEDRLKAVLKIRGIISKAITGLEDRKVTDKRAAWALLGFLCVFSTVPWQYPYHLGIFGLFEIFQNMLHNCDEDGQKKEGRLFIVGELPEELSHYRHQVAARLNALQGNLMAQGSQVIKRRVHVFTGDVGLHVSISEHENEHLLPRIRCAYCNYNNETVLKTIEGQDNYHDPSEILEVPIKRLNSAMIYLCTKHNHFPEGLDYPKHFLSHPILRVI